MHDRDLEDPAQRKIAPAAQGPEGPHEQGEHSDPNSPGGEVHGIEERGLDRAAIPGGAVADATIAAD